MTHEPDHDFIVSHAALIASWTKRKLQEIGLTVSTHDFEDILQEVKLNIWRRQQKSQLDPRWIPNIVWYAIIDLFRKDPCFDRSTGLRRWTTTRLEHHHHGLLYDEQEKVDGVEDFELRDLLSEALDPRDFVILEEVAAGRTQAVAAERVGVSEATVSNVIRKCRAWAYSKFRVA